MSSTYKVKKPAAVGSTTVASKASGQYIPPYTPPLTPNPEGGPLRNAGGNAPLPIKQTAAPAAPAVSTGLPAGIVDTSAQPAAVAPPQTLSGADTRLGATSDYTTLLPNLNQQLEQLAEDYGGVKNYTQLGYDPATGADSQTSVGAVDNPNSQLDVLRRNLVNDQASQAGNDNAVNSYFSGAHLKSAGDLYDTEGRGELSAQESYEAALGQLMTQIQQAQNAREGGYRSANEADVSAAQGTTPVAEAPTTVAGTYAAGNADPAVAAYLKAVYNSQHPAPVAATGRLEAGPTNSTGSRGTAPAGNYLPVAPRLESGAANSTGSRGTAPTAKIKKKK